MSKIFSVFGGLIAIAAGTLAMAQAAELATVQRLAVATSAGYDGSIEAVTETRMAAQVPGLIKQVLVKAGQPVSQGQLLLEIDASQARQQQAALQAQSEATRAQLLSLEQELKRQQQLFAQGYISKGALERIEAEQQATRARLAAQQAQTRAAAVQTGFFRITAPYDGILIDVPAMQGDMAMPGMLLLSLFEPAALRVGVSVPVSALPPGEMDSSQLRVLQGNRELAITRVQRLPTADAGSQSVRLRLDLEPGVPVLPGQAVKVQLLRAGLTDDKRLFVPAAAIVRRAELTGVYVHSPRQNAPLLRQVRLGGVEGNLHEVLSGLAEGEQVYLDPHAVSKE